MICKQFVCNGCPYVGSDGLLVITNLYGEQNFENLYSPDKVHPVANNENKNKIKLTNLTKNNAVIHTARSDNKQYTMHRRPQLHKSLREFLMQHMKSRVRVRSSLVHL